MSQLVRRLSYSIPLTLLALFLIVENALPVRYVLDSRTGPLTYFYMKLFKPESLRYSNALLELGQGVKALAGASGGARAAALHFRLAATDLAEVHRVWAFERLPRELSGDDFDTLRKDVAAAAEALEKGNLDPEGALLARIRKYLDRAKTSLQNGTILE